MPHPEPKKGERVVLEPEGLVGRVGERWVDDGEVYFTIEATIASTDVRLRGDRWRPLMGIAEAERVEQMLARAAGIDGLGWRPSFARLDVEAPERLILEAYLEGTREQQVTGYATLLDWSAAAGEAYGFAKGALATAGSVLLGELAIVRGQSAMDYVRHLGALRAATATRVVVSTPPALPEAPSTRVEDAGWLPGPAGSYDLGTIEVDDVLAIIADCWSDAGPELDIADDIAGSVCGPVTPGRWRARLFIQDEALPPAVEREVERRGDDQGDPRITLGLALRRSWLVLAHESRPAVMPEPDLGPDVRRWVTAFLADDTAGDALEALTLRVADQDAGEALERVAHLEIFGARIAVVASAVLTRPIAAALRATDVPIAAGWRWGVTYRSGDADALPIFAGGPAGRRTLLAIPAGFL